MPSLEDRCPLTIVAPKLLSGNVTFAVGDSPFERHPLSSDPFLEEPSPERLARQTAPCFIRGPAVRALAGFDEVPGDAPFLDCDSPTLSVYLFAPAVNIWSLGEGRHEESNGLGFGAVVDVSERGEQGTSVFECGYASSEPTIVDVARATGGTAPYPAGVTSDYDREFTIHIIALGLQSRSSTPCPRFSLTVEAQFSETAADSVNEPDARCEHEIP